MANRKFVLGKREDPPELAPEMLVEWVPGTKAALRKRLEATGVWKEANEYIRQRRNLWRKYHPYNRASTIAWREMEAKYPVVLVVKGEHGVIAMSDPDAATEEMLAAATAEPVPEPVVESEPAIGQHDLKRTTLWVWQNLENPEMTLEASPSRGAWSLLSWARTYRSRFFEVFLPKATKDADDELGDRVAGEKRSIQEIRDILQKMVDGGRN